MHTKAKMGLGGALVSLVSGSTGAYLYFTQETDIDRVLSLSSSRKTKKGRCMVRLTKNQGTTLTGGEDFSEFYKKSKDQGESIAKTCLKKFSEINKDTEDVVVSVSESNGKYIFGKVTLESGLQ